MKQDQNSPEKRLQRVETRLTNFGRHMGFDLTVPPPPNEPDQPVFISDGAVYVTPLTTVAQLSLAVLRYRFFVEEDREVPVIMNRRTIALIDPIALRDPSLNFGAYDGEDHSEDASDRA